MFALRACFTGNFATFAQYLIGNQEFEPTPLSALDQLRRARAAREQRRDQLQREQEAVEKRLSELSAAHGTHLAAMSASTRSKIKLCVGQKRLYDVALTSINDGILKLDQLLLGIGNAEMTRETVHVLEGGNKQLRAQGINPERVKAVLDEAAVLQDEFNATNKEFALAPLATGSTLNDAAIEEELEAFLVQPEPEPAAASASASAAEAKVDKVPTPETRVNKVPTPTPAPAVVPNIRKIALKSLV